MNKKQKLKESKWLKDLKMQVKEGVRKIKSQVKEVKRIKTLEELDSEKKIKEKRKRRIIIIIILLLLLLLLFIKIIFIGNGIKIAKGNNEVSKVKNENTIFKKINKDSEIKISTENIIREDEILESDDIEVNNKNNEIKNDKNTYKINNNENYVNGKKENDTIKNNLNENQNIKVDENTNEKNEEIENNKNNNQENIGNKGEENNIEDNKESDKTNNTEDNENNNKEEINNANEQNKEDKENAKPNNEGNKEPTQQEETKIKYYISGKVITENINNENIATTTLYRKSTTETNENLGTQIAQVKTNKDGTYKILIYEAKESEVVDLNNNNIPDEIEGIYNIKITKQGYLNSTITGIKFNKNINILQIGTYKLIAGDVDESDIIELMDLVTVINYYDTIITEENKEEMQKYDLNEDGKIDELDKDIVMKNYDKYAKEEVWQDIN